MADTVLIFSCYYVFCFVVTSVKMETLTYSSSSTLYILNIYTILRVARGIKIVPCLVFFNPSCLKWSVLRWVCCDQACRIVSPVVQK